MTVSAQNFTFGYLIKYFVHCYFWVLTNAKRFFAVYMIKVQCSRVRVVTTFCAAAIGFYFVD